EHDHGVLAAREEQHRTLELGRGLPHDEDRLGLKEVELRKLVPSDGVAGLTHETRLVLAASAEPRHGLRLRRGDPRCPDPLRCGYWPTTYSTTPVDILGYPAGRGPAGCRPTHSRRSGTCAGRRPAPRPPGPHCPTRTGRPRGCRCRRSPTAPSRSSRPPTPSEPARRPTGSPAAARTPAAASDSW